MLQFGEILALTLSLITLVYLATYWRRICAQPLLRPFVGPFLVLMIAFVSTVVEGVFLEGANIPWIVFGEDSIRVAADNPASALFNLAEHAAYTAATIWMLVATWQLFRRRQGTPT
jgi:hypothetical protein